MPESGKKSRMSNGMGFYKRTLSRPDGGSYLIFIPDSTIIPFLFLGNKGMVSAQKIMTNK
jgi:hypothetical protein